MAVVLYDYWRSSTAYRLRIALGLAGIAFESRPVDLLRGEHTEDAYLCHNPQGQVPTLYLDGHRFTQSLAAIEYLDETGRGQFLPKDPAGQARVRTIAYSIAMEIHPVCNLKVSRRVAEMTGRKDSAAEWMRHFMSTGLEAVERLLKSADTGLYCHGDKPTMADICLLPQVYNALRRDLPIGQLDRIASIAARLRRLDAFAAAHPDNFKPGGSHEK